MKKLASVMLLFGCVYANARQISPGEAMTLASDFMNSTELRASSGTKALKPMRAPGVNAESQNSPYYVFNRGEADGFVIISGDDRAPKVLGYSDRGSFNADNLPPQLKAMMERWAEQMTNLPMGASQHSSWTVTPATRADEGILLETANWGQGDPYNGDTPLFDGKHAPTGCVATAMAIVMKYHKWPESYDWDAMPMEIQMDGVNPPSPNAELARLMKDAGEAVCMTYSAEEGYATFGWIGAQMRNVFDYAPDSQYITPSHFSTEEWIALIENNLKNENPIIFCGNGTGNHAFVVDGYKDDLYHVNWGWDGYCNGYFSLESLNPNEVQSFSNWIGMAVNIAPNYSGKRYSECFVDCGYLGGLLFANGLPMNISVEDIKKDEPFDVSLVSFVKPEGFIGEIGLAIVDENEYIKEVLMTQPLTYFDAHSSTYDYVNLCVSKEVSPTDRLQIVTKRDTENDYKLVIGTLEKPSYISVIGNNPEFTKIQCNVDEGINLKLTKGNEYIQVQNRQLITYEILKGLYIGYRCEFEDATQIDANKIIALSLTTESGTGDYSQSGKQLYRMPSPFIENNYRIAVKTVDLISKEIVVSSPGTLSQLITEEDAIRIAHLTLAGNINSNDISFINKCCSSLISLDMGKTQIVETLYDDGSFVVSEANMFPYGGLNGYFLNNLKSIIFPESLEGFDDYSFNGFEKITNLIIPAKVNHIGKGAFSNCQGLKVLCMLNPEPVSVTDDVFLTTRCPEEGTLYVPVGSSEKYKRTPIWKDFKSIIEGLIPSEIIVESVILSQQTAQLKVGEGVALIAEVLPIEATDRTVVWNSDNEAVATVDANGNVTAVALGTATITASCGNYSASCLVTVIATPVESVTISQQTAELKVGEGVALIAEVLPIEATDRTVVWNSDNEAVATVDASGNVTAVALGTATITASCGNYSAACVVTVIATPVESVTISQQTAELKVGEGVTLIAEVLPIEATDRTVVWNSDNEAVATVDANGNVTAVALGTATITASCGNYSASCFVTVVPTLVETIQLTPDNWSGIEGESFSISAIILPEEATEKSVIWTSSDESVATVDAEGNVSVLKEGSCAIRATAADGSGAYAECVINSTSGVEDLYSDSDRFDIYDLNGVQVKKDAEREDLNRLTPGIYIIRCGAEMKKLVVR